MHCAHEPGFGSTGTYSGTLEFSRAWTCPSIEMCLLLSALAVSNCFFNRLSTSVHILISHPYMQKNMVLPISESFGCSAIQMRLLISFPYSEFRAFSHLLIFSSFSHLLSNLSFVSCCLFSNFLECLSLFSKTFYYYFGELSRDGRG